MYYTCLYLCKERKVSSFLSSPRTIFFLLLLLLCPLNIPLPSSSSSSCSFHTSLLSPISHSFRETLLSLPLTQFLLPSPHFPRHSTYSSLSSWPKLNLHIPEEGTFTLLFGGTVLWCVGEATTPLLTTSLTHSSTLMANIYPGICIQNDRGYITLSYCL